ncbi:MAG: chromosome segregation protein SMC, partial [Acidobacteria bacterium]|nr:chromosome segregation protein SMC [Acidobacteriota bacterium]
TLAEPVAAKEQEHAKLQAVSYETEQKLTAARARLADLNVEAERTRGRLESQVKESGAIEQRIAQRERESKEMESVLARLEEELGAHRKNVQELERQIALAREQMMQKNQARDALQGRLREREKALEAGRQSILRLLGESSTLKNQLAQIDEYLAGIERETARSKREEETATAELERLAAAKKSLAETMAQRQLELESVTAERRRTEEELAVRRRTAVEVRGKIDAARAECSQIKARKESLEQILEHRTYTTESVKRLFAALEKGRAQDLRPLGVLADFVEVDPAYEKPVEEFLHEELEYVVVENWQQAGRGLDFLRSDLEGRATFLVHPDGQANGTTGLPEPSVGPETGILGRLSDYVKLSNGFKDRAVELMPRVSLCYLAGNREAAERLAVAYPHLYFLLNEGFCYHGHTVSGGKKTATGPLAIKREARELTGRLQAKQKELDAVVARLQDTNQEIAELESELERLRGLQQAREKDRVALDHEIRKVAEDTNRANSRCSVARLELERLRRDSERSAEQREKNRSAIEEKDALRASKEQALEAQRQELDKLEIQLASVSEEHSVLRVELAGLEERHRGERAAMGRLENQFRETTNRRSQIAPEIERLGVNRARLLADNIELDRKATLTAEEIRQIEAQVNLLAAEEARMRESLRGGEETLKQLRAQSQEAHDRRSQIEVELVKRQAELKFLDETSRKELNCPVEQLAGSEETIPDADTLTEAERVYSEVRNRIESLGPVNLQAMEEYEETLQRHEFLTAQRQDLIDSIRDTEKAIQDIDLVSRRKFGEAFEAINANFRQCFQTLFGGGTGEMRLTDESNLADSGIDIVASPPGKKLQNVLLLSGGEKALAAVALLMSIFRYTPSPFCIMDEVDAPLDESNIERLSRLIKEMSVQTQFIVITHSRKTMESASALYGVTMQEPGVSRLVSVKFQPPQTRPAQEMAAV